MQAKCYFSSDISETLSCCQDGRFDLNGYPENICDQYPCEKYNRLVAEIDASKSGGLSLLGGPQGGIDTMSNTLTCVYCGMAYPEGTPPHGSQILTDHIKICEKHPLRAAEATIVKLRSALAGLVGVDGKEELEQMEAIIRVCGDAPSKDKTVAIDAIHALLDTL